MPLPQGRAGTPGGQAPCLLSDLKASPPTHPFYDFPGPGKRELLPLARIAPSLALLVSLPLYQPIMLFTFVPPETAGALGTGSLERHSHSEDGSHLGGRG